MKEKITKKDNKATGYLLQSSLFTKNTISLVIGILVVFVLYKSIGGYKWLWDSLVVGNLTIIKQYADADIIGYTDFEHIYSRIHHLYEEWKHGSLTKETTNFSIDTFSTRNQSHQLSTLFDMLKS